MTEQFTPSTSSHDGRILAGRRGDPAELAAAVVWRAGPAATSTGQTLAVDGGVTIT